MVATLSRAVIICTAISAVLWIVDPRLGFLLPLSVTAWWALYRYIERG